MTPNFFKMKNKWISASRRKLLKRNMMAVTVFLSFPMLCEKNNCNLCLEEL